MRITLDNYKKVLADKMAKHIGILPTDEIIFSVNGKNFIYYNQERYLVCGNDSYNSAIFKELGLNPIEFCEKVWHLTPDPGDFPEYPSLTPGWAPAIQIVTALFEECALQSKPIKQLDIEPLSANSCLKELLPEEKKKPFKSIKDFLGSTPFDDFDQWLSSGVIRATDTRITEAELDSIFSADEATLRTAASLRTASPIDFSDFSNEI